MRAACGVWWVMVIAPATIAGVVPPSRVPLAPGR